MTARVNSFAGWCPICKQQVLPQQGVVWKDPVTNKWVTFCAADTPDDIGEIRPGYSRSRYHRPTKTIVPPTVATTTTATVAPTTSACAKHQPGPADKTCEDCWVQAGTTRTIARQLAFQHGAGVFPANKSVPTMPGQPTIVVFYGPIKSASDGDEHFIYPRDVAALHGINSRIEALTHVEFVSPDNKQTWRPPLGEYFIVGPHFRSSEYDEASEALAEWLAQRGITA